MKTIEQWWCGIKGHDWTCAVEEGIKPTKVQLANGMDGFMDYATTYCKKCGHVLTLKRP